MDLIPPPLKREFFSIVGYCENWWQWQALIIKKAIKSSFWTFMLLDQVSAFEQHRYPSFLFLNLKKRGILELGL